MIIGVSGYARAGKDTTADVFVYEHGFTKVAFADPIKRVCREIYDFTDEQLWGEDKEKHDHRYPREPKMRVEGDDFKGPSFLTPRYATQSLGTEWGRDCFPDTWAAYGLRMAKMLLEGGYHYTAKLGIFEGDFAPPHGVVFSDVRFRNEMRLIVEAGGKLIRVKRQGAGLQGEAGLHQSEQEQASIPDHAFHTIIENDGTLDDLRARVHAIVQEFKAR